ncbi:MAG: phosphoadenosine phosphosulfate reductase, partial [Candidatus Paceibacterota bacterium]
MEEESLAELAKEERRNEIKRQHLKRKQNGSGKKSKTLLSNLLNEDEKEEYFDKEDEDYAGCTVCFI